MLIVYFGARFHGEFERRAAIAELAAARDAATARAALRAPPLLALRDGETVGEPAEPLSGRAPLSLRPALAVGTSAAAAGPRRFSFSVSAQPGVAVSPSAESRWPARRIDVHRAEAAEGEALLPTALLRIRSVDLEVPVYPDTSERNLHRGAGHVEGTAPPAGGGNTVIAAHRDSHFRPLEDVAIGDFIEIETLTAQRRYRITSLSIVQPTDLWPLSDTASPMVTLVTCYPFYFVGNAPQRFIVRAAAVGNEARVTDPDAPKGSRQGDNHEE